MRRSNRFWLLAGLMTTSFLLGSWLGPRVRIEWEPGPQLPQAHAQAPRTGIGSDEPVARAVRIAGPSVVNLDTVKQVVVRDELDWLFERGPRVYERRGAGSGVVIDPRGYVLTNQHVVGDRGDNVEIWATFENGQKVRGTVVGRDRETDVALIRLQNPPALQVAKLGDSEKLVPGQWAIAIGNPYGYEQTVTVGVVGHTGRVVDTGDRVYRRLIQTDAAINPGNSGGPLVDIQGRVIGINTVVRADAQGIGFAIPINTAREIVGELIAHGKVKRPWVGLYCQDVSDEVARYLGLRRRDGAFVEKLVRQGPAWRAGVRPGDVIRELGGRKIQRGAEVDDLIGKAKIGDRIPILVEREGELLKGELSVIESP